MHKVNPFRVDALEKVTGTAQYSGDYYMDGMLEVSVCWPPAPCARIIKIDTSLAEQAPGVYRVVTRKDIVRGNNKVAVFDPFDRPILVGEGEEVRFGGDAVALVVAETKDQADRARELIKVDYEELPAINSLEEARGKIEPHLEKRVEKGNVEEGFAKSDVIVERRYSVPLVEHVYLEPEGGYAYKDNRGTINVCFGSQNLGRHHRMVCKSLELPFSKVRLCGPYIGGAFGGKHSFSVQVYLTLLGSLIDRPVRLVFTREESMSTTCKKHELDIQVKMGFSKDGKIQVVKSLIESASAPYLGYARNTMDFVCRYVFGPYSIPNIEVLGLIYRSTNPETGAFRGFGGPDGAMVAETMMDQAAAQLNIDPLELRRLNWLKDDELSEHYPGAPWRNMSETLSLPEVMEKAFANVGPKPQPSGKNKLVGRGYGNALPCFGIGNTPGYVGTGCEMMIFLDGSLLVKLGFPEAGQGMSAIATAIASKAMDIDEDKINVYLCDSHKTPKAGSLGFSQGTVSAGNAIISAATRLKANLEDYARECLKTDDPDIYFSRGAFWKGDQKVLEWTDVADLCYYGGKNLSSVGWTVAPDDRDLHGITSIGTVVDVEVDTDTGEVKVLQVSTAFDIGNAIHYDSARGQMLGGAVMSLGGVQSEEFLMKDGKCITPSLAEYLIPTSMDIPLENKITFVENYGKDCPFGAKGMGEHGLYSIPPAYLNAIFDATGVMLTEVPVTPERLLRALGKIK